MLTVRINDTVTVPFVLDTGAAEVSIPDDVFSVLRRSGTISQNDFIGSGSYMLAGGATVSSDRYVLRKMSLGGHIITDVVANVVSSQGEPLDPADRLAHGQVRTGGRGPLRDVVFQDQWGKSYPGL